MAFAGADGPGFSAKVAFEAVRLRTGGGLDSEAAIVRMLSVDDFLGRPRRVAIDEVESRRCRTFARGLMAEPLSCTSPVTSVKLRFFRIGMRLGGETVVIMVGADVVGLDLGLKISRSRRLIEEEE